MGSNLRWSYFIPVVIILSLAALFWFYLDEIKSGKSIQDLPSVLINKPIPTFQLPGIENKDKGFNSEALIGKVALVNIWSSWCPPCRAEHRFLMKLAEKGIPIYGINYKDNPYDAKKFLTQLGNPYKSIGADRNGRVTIDWGVYGYPETFIIDKIGYIRYRHIGPIMEDDLTHKIRPIIKALSK